MSRAAWLTSVLLAVGVIACRSSHAQSGKSEDPPSRTSRPSGNVGPHDWPMWGGSPSRMNTTNGVKIPTQWNIGEKFTHDQVKPPFAEPKKVGIKPWGSENVKWAVPLGSETWGNPVIANGRVFIGTNNGNGYLKRFPPSMDLGVLICFEEATGNFLWQHSNEKLPTGRVNDWPNQGVCSTPIVDGNRLWYVTNQGHVVCLDTDGFYDEEDDGIQDRPSAGGQAENEEADVVWRLDMMRELGTFQHNMANCSMLCVEGVLMVCTSNGLGDDHQTIPAPQAPSFIAVDRTTGKVLWTDNSPGENILHAQWASPSYGVFEGQPQVIFPGGDGWLYSFDPRGSEDGRSKMLWKFDGNAKTSTYRLYYRNLGPVRMHYVGFPVIYDGLIYIAMGEDPEHGERPGQLWCIDPTKRLDGGDVSPELAVDRNGTPLSPRRVQNVDESQGEVAIPNPDSAVVWNYESVDQNQDGRVDFEETFHASVSSVVIQDDVLYIPDYSGVLHCMNAKSGDVYWTYDMYAACWGSPLLVDGKTYLGTEDGDMLVFRHTPATDIRKRTEPLQSQQPEPDSKQYPHFFAGSPYQGELLATVHTGQSVYLTPVIANNVLFIAARNTLYAISDTLETP